jgi:hypothetical protein
LRSKLVRKDTRCKIYKTLIRPLVLYGCDSWTVIKTNEGKLSIFERKILRKIYGSSCVNGGWRIKSDDKLYSLYKEPGIVKMIKIARLKCLEHIARIENNVPCRNITFFQPQGSRKKGWLDSVLKDLKTLEVIAWWKKAWDRDLWSEIIK